jgi:hypothetical protein
MVGRLFGGTGRWRDKYRDIVPDSEEMAIWAQNATDQFTDPRLSPLNSEDAMERYQIQVAKTSTPEIRVPQEHDKVLEGRKRAHLLINRLAHGGPRGNSDLAYKPELTQSNASVYTYAVPSTDPIIAGRDRNGDYHSDVNGNTIFRMKLPNHQSNAELSTKMFNVQNRMAKYAANVKRVENTSQIVDFIPGRKDKKWIDRALDTYRHRLMPRITTEDNADNLNREKNKCRDKRAINHKYTHKDYDTNIELNEVLDNTMRTMPVNESGGPSIGDLIVDMTNDEIITQSTNSINPNRNKHTKKSTAANDFPDVEESDGDRSYRRNIHNETIRDNTFIGLDPIKQAILGAEVVEEIIRGTKTEMRARRKEIVNNSVLEDDGHMVDEDVKSSNIIRSVNNEDDDIEHKVFLTQIPGLQKLFKDKTLVNKNQKLVGNNSGQKRGYSVRDNGIVNDTESDNNNIKRSKEDITSIQGVRNLIKDLAPVEEFGRLNSRINPNRKNVYKDGKIVKRGVNHSQLFTTPEESNLYNSRIGQMKIKNNNRPYLPEGINYGDRIQFESRNKPINKKRIRPDPVRRIKITPPI